MLHRMWHSLDDMFSTKITLMSSHPMSLTIRAHSPHAQLLPFVPFRRSRYLYIIAAILLSAPLGTSVVMGSTRVVSMLAGPLASQLAAEIKGCIALPSLSKPNPMDVFLPIQLTRTSSLPSPISAATGTTRLSHRSTINMHTPRLYML